MELIMNTVGIYGSHPEDQYRARELDRYLDSQEWSTDDIEKAKQGLYDAIRYFGKEWDENLVSYRLEMLTTIEEILHSNIARIEKLAEIDDVMDRYIKLYCEDEVEGDPDAYCEKYCSQFENEE
jgi:hypothetical protein